MLSIKKHQTKQPKGVFVLFFLQLIGMIGFSFIYSLAVLYCTKVLNFSDHSSYAIISAFNALAFVTSVPGGFIAEKYLGFHFATIVSILLSVAGLVFMSFTHIMFLYLGLGIFIMGTGIVIPCLFVLLGRLYQKTSLNRENGFMISYIGMNLGAFLASGISGTIANVLGYQITFLLGGGISFMMLPVFLYYQNLFVPAANKKVHETRNKHTLAMKYQGLSLVIISCIMCTVLVKFSSFCNSLLLILGVACFIYVIKIALSFDGLQRKKLFVFIILTTASILFWTLYQLSPSLLTLFTERNVDRTLFGITIPTADFSCLNPLFIVLLGPLISGVWRYLLNRNILVSIPTKFALATLLMGGGYFVLVEGIDHASTVGIVGLIYLIGSYFLQTLGELFIGPVGYAMVGELSPSEKEGTMMGIWQLAAGMSGALSGYFARFASPSTSTNLLVTNVGFAHAFLMFSMITIACGMAIWSLSPYLQRCIKV